MIKCEGTKEQCLYEKLERGRDFQIRRTMYISLLCVLVGIISGLGAVGFRYLIDLFYNIFFHGTISFKPIGAISNVSRWGKWVIFVPVVGLTIANFITEKWAPEAKGHGVPEVMAAITVKKGRIRPIVALVKIFASAITIGGGGSVGREGPIVQIGSSFGSTLGQVFKLSPRETIILVGAGAAGGIGATFNAPIGGVMFALELILTEYSIMTIMPLVISSIVATNVSAFFLGESPAFIIPQYSMVSSYELIFHVLIGILAGLLSIIFIKSVYGFEDFVDKLKINTYIKSSVGGLIVGITGLISLKFFGEYYIFGVGYDFMDFVLANKATSIILLLSMVFLKIFANSMTLSCGGSGGIFAPSLFLGAALGGAVGIIANIVFQGNSGPVAAYAMVGMVGVVSGVTGGVITAIIMLFEMTRNYDVMLPVMLCAVIAHFVAQLISPETMYTEKLTRRGICIDFDKRSSSFTTILVKDVCKTNLISCSVNCCVNEAIKLLEDNNLSIIPVIDSANNVYGSISYKELYKVKVDGSCSIEKYINRHNLVIPETCNIYHALEIMEQIMTPILVVKNKENIIGIVTMRKLINSALEKRRLS